MSQRRPCFVSIRRHKAIMVTSSLFAAWHILYSCVSIFRQKFQPTTGTELHFGISTGLSTFWLAPSSILMNTICTTCPTELTLICPFKMLHYHELIPNPLFPEPATIDGPTGSLVGQGIYSTLRPIGQSHRLLFFTTSIDQFPNSNNRYHFTLEFSNQKKSTELIVCVAHCCSTDRLVDRSQCYEYSSTVSRTTTASPIK